MKKLLSIVIIALIFSATACNGDGEHLTIVNLNSEDVLMTADSNSEDTPLTGTEYVAVDNSYIPLSPERKGLEYHGSVPMEWETDYSNISGYTDCDEYSADEAVIHCYIKNTNKNKGFWLHTTMLVQYYDGTDWSTLPYVGDGASDLLGWVFCFGVDHDGNVTSEASIDLNELLATEVVKGDYRIVRFLADRELYMCFKIV